MGVHSKVAKLADVPSFLDGGVYPNCRFKSYPYCTSAFSSMVEHRAHNARDTGSVPVRPTNFMNMETDKKDYDKIYSVVAPM